MKKENCFIILHFLDWQSSDAVQLAEKTAVMMRIKTPTWDRDPVQFVLELQDKQSSYLSRCCAI